MEFHQDLYIPAFKKLVFHLPHVLILGTHSCGNTLQEESKHCSYLQDVLCRCDYSYILVARFAHQIKYEYYGGNTSVSIEVVALGYFSATYQETSSSYLYSCTHHAVFHLFLSDNRKHDSDKTYVHIKRIIVLLKNINFKVMVSVLHGRIQLAVLGIIDVIQTYTYFQYYHNPII